MKKLVVVLVVLVIALGIILVSSANALTLEEIWEENFDPIFDGGVFVNDTVETDVPEEQEELEKDWLEHDVEMFPPGYFNITPREKWTNFPPGYFDVTPREQWTNFPPGWFDIV